MNFVVSSSLSSLKLFVKSLQCLHRVSQHLLLVATPHELKLCALSESGTSYCQMTFAATFFHKYHVLAEKKECAVALKACLAVFRSLATIEKCLVRLDRAEQNLVFELTCMSDAKKSFRIPLDDSSSARQIPLPSALPHGFTAAAKQLGEYLSNFQTVIPEITLAPCANGLSLKSFMSNQSISVEGAGARALYTNMELPSSIFADYRVPFAEPMELTVTLREFKAFVAFGDVIARPLVVKFTATGQPIALSMTGTVGFSADMMLATVSNADDDATASAVSAATSMPTSVKKAPVVKQQPAKSLPATGNNNNGGDDENSSSYYYSYDTSVTNDAGATAAPQRLPPTKTALPPVTKKEKVTAAPKTAAAKTAAPVAAAARRATNSAPNDMLIDNTEQPASDTGRTGERVPHASHVVNVDDEPLDFPPSPTRAIGVGQLFREPSPEI